MNARPKSAVAAVLGRRRPGLPPALRKCCLTLVIVAAAIGAVSAKPRDERPYPQMKREPRPFVIFTNRVTIPTAWKLNPVFWFKNYDQPEPPEKMWPGDPHRNWKWYWRNPCHNFTFYVIGIADKTHVRVGRRPGRVFAPGGGWNWTVSKFKCVRLPFVSYQRGAFHFYLGWRNRGNFGIEFKFSEPKEPAAPKPTGAAGAGGDLPGEMNGETAV